MSRFQNPKCERFDHPILTIENKSGRTKDMRRTVRLVLFQTQTITKKRDLYASTFAFELILEDHIGQNSDIQCYH